MFLHTKSLLLFRTSSKHYLLGDVSLSHHNLFGRNSLLSCGASSHNNPLAPIINSLFSSWPTIASVSDSGSGGSIGRLEGSFQQVTTPNKHTFSCVECRFIVHRIVHRTTSALHPTVGFHPGHWCILSSTGLCRILRVSLPFTNWLNVWPAFPLPLT
jgi:hypothetical protein